MGRVITCFKTEAFRDDFYRFLNMFRRGGGQFIKMIIKDEKDQRLSDQNSKGTLNIISSYYGACQIHNKPVFVSAV